MLAFANSSAASIPPTFVRRGCNGGSEPEAERPTMNETVLTSTLLVLAFCVQGHAQQGKAPPYPRMAPVEQYLIANTHEEIALARSAAPPSISAAAAVLVLGRHGYETAVKGSNGFVCFVERSWTANFDDPEFWNPKGRAPNCFNPPAVRSVLPQYVERSRWVAAGLGRAQLVEKARAAYAAGRFTDPEPGSFSFMLSKLGYLNDAVSGPWLPHVMFFVAHGRAAAWAAGLEASPILGTD